LADAAKLIFASDYFLHIYWVSADKIMISMDEDDTKGINPPSTEISLSDTIPESTLPPGQAPFTYSVRYEPDSD
jgi:hypothetical protein